MYVRNRREAQVAHAPGIDYQSDVPAQARAGGQSKGSRYTPPPSEIRKVASLDSIVDGVREIAPEQQKRLWSEPGDHQGTAPRLFLAGDVGLLKRPCVAIVGTRQVSKDGAARARRLARELVADGVVVMSGLAKGVDTEALSAALEHGGKVIAVIGTPLDKAYPAENKRLQETIYQQHLLVSPFEDGSEVFPSFFPHRNKVMAALSDATVIIEASDTSGTRHQAAECARLGRWLFVAKSLLTDPKVTWPRTFEKYPRMRSLSATEDVLKVLRDSRAWQQNTTTPA
jgi:DNA processing protein